MTDFNVQAHEASENLKNEKSTNELIKLEKQLLEAKITQDEKNLSESREECEKLKI